MLPVLLELSLYLEQGGQLAEVRYYGWRHDEVSLASASRSGQEGRILVLMNTRPAPRRLLPGSPFNKPTPLPPVETFAVQDLVTHDKYGLGTVLSVEDDVAVLVDFGQQHRVRIPVPCSKLSKL